MGYDEAASRFVRARPSEVAFEHESPLGFMLSLNRRMRYTMIHK
jgi:hypothetical protein